jgi:hypothetical protein
MGAHLGGKSRAEKLGFDGFDIALTVLGRQFRIGAVPNKCHRFCFVNGLPHNVCNGLGDVQAVLGAKQLSMALM